MGASNGRGDNWAVLFCRSSTRVKGAETAMASRGEAMEKRGCHAQWLVWGLGAGAAGLEADWGGGAGMPDLAL